MSFRFADCSLAARARTAAARSRCAGAAILALGALGMLASPGAPRAQEHPLTLEAAQRIAVERSRQVSGQDFAVTAAREMAVAAGQLPDPVVRAGIENLPISGGDRFSLTRDFMTMGKIGVMQELTAADKRQVRADRYEREAERARVQKLATTAAVERDTALAWVDRYYAEAIAAAIDEFREQAQLEIDAAEGAYRAGRGSQADVFVARSALAAFGDRASEARRKVRTAKTMLARWVGEAAERPLAGEPPVEAIRLNPATLERDLAHHPQIDVFAKQEAVAAAEAKIAQAAKKPDWTVEVVYQQRGPSYSNMISVGVSIPWQWDRANRQDRELAAKLALVEQARAERDDALRAHVAEAQQMLAEWENGRERLERYRRDLVPLASARIEAAITAYRGGKSSLADVLAARRNEIDVRIQALQLAAETARAWAQLNFLTPTEAAHAASAQGETK
jgi:outer membrane protein TolC